MSSPTLPIETDRLRLRLFEKSDAAAVSAYRADPKVQRYLESRTRDPHELDAILDGLSRRKSLNRPGDTYVLAIELKDDDEVIGEIWLHWYDATASQAELGVVLNPAHRGRSYGTEAACAALDLGFGTFHFHRIQARCDARDPAPARLLKGLGMRLEAHFREHALFQGNWDEELQFAILDREWLRSGAISEFPTHRVA